MGQSSTLTPLAFQPSPSPEPKNLAQGLRSIHWTLWRLLCLIVTARAYVQHLHNVGCRCRLLDHTQTLPIMDHILNRLRPRVSPNVKIKSYNVDSQALHKTLNAAIDGNTQIPLEELLPWEQGPVQRVAPSTEHTAEMINTSMGWMTAQELYDHVLGGGSWSRADEGGHAVLDGSLASKAAHKPALPTMGLLSQCCNREKRHLMGTCAPDRPNSFRNRDSSSGSIALEGAPDDASLAKTCEYKAMH